MNTNPKHTAINTIASLYQLQGEFFFELKNPLRDQKALYHPERNTLIVEEGSRKPNQTALVTYTEVTGGDQDDSPPLLSGGDDNEGINVVTAAAFGLSSTRHAEVFQSKAVENDGEVTCTIAVAPSRTHGLHHIIVCIDDGDMTLTISDADPGMTGAVI